MIVAATSECFPELSLTEAVGRLVDLEYTHIEIAVHEHGNQLKPSEVFGDFDRAFDTCRQIRRLTPVAYSIQLDAEGDLYYQQFASCCTLAKATKVPTLVVESSELGTPFNEEVERLRKLVAIATMEGILVAVKTKQGCMTQDPSTTMVMCDNVKGLGITLDPSCFLYGESSNLSYDTLMKYVYHVHLRDTTPEQYQVRVGQGKVEYGRLINQLRQTKFGRGLSAFITEQDDVDHSGELRKIRLLLESLLL